MKVGQAVEVWTGYGWEVAHVQAVSTSSGIKVSFYFRDDRRWVAPSLVRSFDGVVGYGD